MAPPPAPSSAQALASQLAAADFQADDLPNLARNVYVRCLLKVHGIAGRNMRAKDIALQITAQVMKSKVGFHFTVEDVQSLLDEEEGGEPPPEAPPRAAVRPAG